MTIMTPDALRTSYSGIFDARGFHNPFKDTQSYELQGIRSWLGLEAPTVNTGRHLFAAAVIAAGMFVAAVLLMYVVRSPEAAGFDVVLGLKLACNWITRSLYTGNPFRFRK